MANEDKSQMPLFSPKDEKKAQQRLARLRKKDAMKVQQELARLRKKKKRGFEGKTTWDWLQLLGVLAIPLILGIATLLFGIQQANFAKEQHDYDQYIASRQREDDRQQTLDQQRQATLVTYQDNMKDLLLHQGLLTSKAGDEIRVIARIETLSAMRQLNGKRNSFLLQFLHDAHLIGINLITEKDQNIVNFEHADLSSTDLSGANLSGANLSGANLYKADLTDATLYRADLSYAYLSDATLLRANLYRADLSGAYLGRPHFTDANGELNIRGSGANLSGAYLTGANLLRANLSDANLLRANLTGANLLRADLSGAELDGVNLTRVDLSNATLSNAYNLTQQQLDQVSSCKNAILPPGLTCHHNL